MITEILDRLGIEYVTYGDEAVALCPMHEKRTGKEDSSPSWSINIISGYHQCFSCHYSGGITRLVADIQGVGYKEAEAWSKDLSAPTPTRLRKMLDDIQKREDLQRNLAGLDGLSDVYTFDEAYWRSFPRLSGEMMRSRGLTPETCERHDLRRNGTAYEIPIYTLSGRLIGYQHKDGAYVRNRPKGVKKSETLYGIHLVADQDIIVVVESPLDAALSDQYGHPAVATFGSKVSDRQMSLLSAHTPVLAFDNDDAGKEAEDKTSRGLTKLGVPHKIVAWPSDMKDFGDDPKRIPELIAGAEDTLERRCRTIRL